MTEQPSRIGICAGEMSGDLLAGAVMEAWANRGSHLKLTGIGGSRLQAAGLQSLCPMDRLSVMGLVEPLKRLPELLSIRRQLIAQQLGEGPDLFLGSTALTLIYRWSGACDVPVSRPRIWSAPRCGHGAKGGLRSSEKPPRECCAFYLLRSSSIVLLASMPYVGHPLVDELSLLPDAATVRQTLGLAEKQSIVGVLPGSREAEVRQHLPIFAGAMTELCQRHPDLEFVIPAANAERRAQIQQMLRGVDLPLTVIEGQGRAVMQASNALMIASGTATLEAMLLGKPMVIGYRMAGLSWFILSRLVTSPFVGLPNILAGEAVAPELLQQELTPAQLADAVSDLLSGSGDAQTARYQELAGQIGGNFADRCVDALLPLTQRS